MTKILFEAYTQFERLLVFYSNGTCIVKSQPYGEDCKPTQVFVGSYDECIAFVKDEVAKDLESRIG